MNKRRFYISLIFILTSIRCIAQAPNVTYLSSYTLVAGVEMTSIKPTSAADKTVTYSVNPKLPDGLNLDPTTGTISGKPDEVTSGDYSITAIKEKKPGIPFTLKIIVSPPTCDACGSSDKSKSNLIDIKTTRGHCLTCGEWWLVFMPVVLFSIFLIVFLLYIRIGKIFSLKLALSEDTYPQIIEDNPLYNQANLQQLINLEFVNTTITTLPIATLFSPTITKTEKIYRPSISRLIVFLTSMVSLVIGLALSCFFIYWYLKTGCVPDIGKLTTVLLTMGIGVVPYAFNKVTGAIGDKGGTGNNS